MPPQLTMAVPVCNKCSRYLNESFHTEVHTLLSNIKEGEASNGVEIKLSIQGLVDIERGDHNKRAELLDVILLRVQALDISEEKMVITVNLISEMRTWLQQRSSDNCNTLLEIVGALESIADKETMVDESYPSLSKIKSFIQKMVEKVDDDWLWIGPYYKGSLKANKIETKKKFDELNISLTNLQGKVEYLIQVQRMMLECYPEKLLCEIWIILDENKKTDNKDLFEMNAQVGLEGATQLVEIGKLMSDNHKRVESNFTDRDLALGAVVRTLTENIGSVGNLSYILKLMEVNESHIGFSYPHIFVGKALHKLNKQLIDEDGQGMCGRKEAAEICQETIVKLDDWMSKGGERPQIEDLIFQAYMCIHNAQELHYNECSSCREQCEEQK